MIIVDETRDIFSKDSLSELNNYNDKFIKSLFFLFYNYFKKYQIYCCFLNIFFLSQIPTCKMWTVSVASFELIFVIRWFLPK